MRTGLARAKEHGRARAPQRRVARRTTRETKPPLSTSDLHDSRSTARATRAAVALSFAVPLLLFLPTVFGADFVYDSYLQVLRDDFLHDSAHLWDVLTLRVLGMDVLDANRPMLLLSLMLDALVWGRSPIGFHLTSVLMHAVNSALLCMLLIRLTQRAGRPLRSPYTAALLTLVFAVHPVVTEAVCVVSFREDLLVTAFVLGALLLLDTAGTSSAARRRALLLVAACQLGAIASKESGVVLAIAGVVYWLTFRRTESRSFVLALAAATGAVSVAFLALRFALQADGPFAYAPPPIADSPTRWVAVQTRIWGFQVWSLFDPRVLSAYYTVPAVRALPGAIAGGAVAVAGLALAFCAWRSRVARMGVVLVVGALLPVANLIPINIPVADRYLYLPLAGLVLVAGGVLSPRTPDAPGTGRRGTATSLILLALVLLLAVANYQRQQVFRSRVSLWEDALRVTPAAPVIQRFLAYAYFDLGQHADAERLLEGAIAASRAAEPVPEDQACLAMIAMARGDEDRARDLLQSAIARDARIGDPAALRKSLSLVDPDKLAEIIEQLGLD